MFPPRRDRSVGQSSDRTCRGALVRSLGLGLGLSFAVTTVACDSEPEGPSETEKALAAKKAAEEKEIADRVAARKAEDAAKEKAAEEAEAAKQAKLVELCVLPEKMPKNLDKACKEVAAANDRFMIRLYEGEAVEKWNEAKSTQLAMTTAQCNKFWSLEAAACQINAMDKTEDDMKKALPDLLRTCNEKFPKAE